MFILTGSLQSDTDTRPQMTALCYMIQIIIQFDTTFYFAWNRFLLIFYREKWKYYSVKYVLMENFANMVT